MLLVHITSIANNLNPCLKAARNYENLTFSKSSLIGIFLHNLLLLSTIEYNFQNIKNTFFIAYYWTAFNCVYEYVCVSLLKEQILNT